MCARAIQPSHKFHFNHLHNFRLLISIILCDCVCSGHTAIPQISLSSVTSLSYFRLLISIILCIILCDCVCRGHTAISRISLKSVTSESYLSIGQLVRFDNTRFKFNLDSFFLPFKINFVIISCLRASFFY